MFKKLQRAVGQALGTTGMIPITTELTVRHFRADGKEVKKDRRRIVNKVVTTAFVDFIVDQLQAETSVFGDFKYHDSGTGIGVEAAADTALGTPCGEARDAGTQAENAHNIYESVATHTYAGSFAITEHGLFNASSGPTLMDRTLFTAVNVTTGEKIEFTYRITFTAGG